MNPKIFVKNLKKISQERIYYSKFGSFFIKTVLCSYSPFWFVARVEAWRMELTTYLIRLTLPSLSFNPKTHSILSLHLEEQGDSFFKGYREHFSSTCHVPYSP